MWLNSTSSPAISGGITAQSDFNRLMQVNVTLREHGTSEFDRLLRKRPGSSEFDRLLRQPRRDLRRLAWDQARNAYAQNSARRAARQVNKSLAKRMLRMGLTLNPYAKLGMNVLDIFQMLQGGAVSFQAPDTTIIDAQGFRRARGYNWETAGGPPFPEWPGTQITNHGPPYVYQRIYLPYTANTDQHFFHALLNEGLSFGQPFQTYGRTVAIPAGGPGRFNVGYLPVLGTGGGRRRSKDMRPWGRYHWHRQVPDHSGWRMQSTRVGITIDKNGGPPVYDDGRGRGGRRESKPRMTGRVYGVLRYVADAMGGFVEMIELLADAAGWSYQDEIGGTRVYNMMVYLFVWGGIELVDFNSLVDGLIWNEFEDRLFGTAGRMGGQGGIDIGRIVGTGTGPAL